MLIDLGGGTKPHPRADVVIDMAHPKNSPAQDAAASPWQFGESLDGQYETLPDGVAEHVFSSHFLEHIPKGPSTITVMNEAWRVLRRGGIFTMVLPIIGWTGRQSVGQMVNSWQPYADPTHVQGWWLPESLLYFTQGALEAYADYGIEKWAPLGPFIMPGMAEVELRTLRSQAKVSQHASFWSVRFGWEGVARLMKPL